MNIHKSFLLAIVLLAVSVSSFANTISGAISLPSGVVAGPGGVRIEVYTIPREIFSDEAEDTVTIPAGANSGSYRLSFTTNEDRAVTFECLSGCVRLGITTEGGWDVNDGVVGTFTGTALAGNQNHRVNVRLEPADIFQGTVRFPAGFVAKGTVFEPFSIAEFISVNVSSTDFFSFGSFGSASSLEAGDTEYSFAFGAPTNFSSGGWELRVSCSRCGPLVRTATQYATTSVGDPVTRNDDFAFRFSRGVDHRNLTLTLLGTSPAVPTISEDPAIQGALLLLLGEE